MPCGGQTDEACGASGDLPCEPTPGGGGCRIGASPRPWRGKLRRRPTDRPLPAPCDHELHAAELERNSPVLMGDPTLEHFAVETDRRDLLPAPTGERAYPAKRASIARQPSHATGFGLRSGDSTRADGVVPPCSGRARNSAYPPCATKRQRPAASSGLGRKPRYANRPSVRDRVPAFQCPIRLV